jgi:hypothetical protein
VNVLQRYVAKLVQSVVVGCHLVVVVVASVYSVAYFECMSLLQPDLVD